MKMRAPRKGFCFFDRSSCMVQASVGTKEVLCVIALVDIPPGLIQPETYPNAGRSESTVYGPRVVYGQGTVLNPGGMELPFVFLTAGHSRVSVSFYFPER